MAGFNDIFAGLKQTFLKDAKGRFKKRSSDDLNNIKNQIIGRMAEHPVTQELETNNESKFIQSTNGRSFSLFGVLGFEAGRSPRQEIINALNDEIEVIESADGTKFSLRIPDLNDLDGNQDLTLEGRSKSWVFYIEEGVDNLAFYYEKPGMGRSTVGWQNNTENNLGRSFDGADYLMSVIKEFKEKYRGVIKFE